ncbi:YfhO family protein [Rufibacter psychrotolerans]|uniref:YfhO family protein n=1 Tax=Rufibacter psychrotolerans TaxID=2812556 RepID=UPI00196882D8|nr:YfhO family protein [Rufibacter sp. SYSU D00308]
MASSKLDFNRQVLPHLLVLLFFLLLVVAYFSPIFFDGKSLMQHDVVQFQGGAKEIADYRERTGEEALWTNSMFSGMPAYLISVQFSGDLFQYVHSLFTAGLPLVASNIFITLVCAYIMFVVFGLRPMLAAVGAIAYTFVSYNFAILEAGHNTKSLAIAYLPLVLAGLWYAYRKNLLIGAALFTFGLTMHIRTNHLQITYYLLLIVLIFGIVELVSWAKEGRIADFFKRTLILALGAALAAGVSFGRIYTTAEYGKYSIRGASELTQGKDASEIGSGLDREYAFQWSYGVGETMTLLVPNFYGGASQGPLEKDSETYKQLAQGGVPEAQLQNATMPFYWGDQSFVGGPVYMGAIVCFLFVLGLLVTPRRLWIWLLSATILSFMLSWGKNFEAFNYFMFDYFPGYNKFRAVSMALVIAQVTMTLLAVLALCRVIQNEPIENLPKKILIALGATGGLCLLLVLLSGTFDYVGAVDEQLAQYQYPIQAIREDREAMLRGDAFRSLVFILLAAGTLYFYTRKKMSSFMATAVIGLLILVDLWTVDKRYLNNDDFQKDYSATFFQPTRADQIILQDKELSYRVYNVANPFNEARTSYFHKSIGGYHGAKLRRYQDVIEQHIAQGNIQVLNMLNAKYAITGQEQNPVQLIPGYLGNAWYVDEVRAVNSPDEELAALKGIDAKHEAIVDVSKFPNVKPQRYTTTGSIIKLVEYQPNYLKYTAVVAQPGVAVFSEIYYADGWQAYLNGKPVDHFRANYILRAMHLPAGNHVVEFKFEPNEYSLGNTVALISSLLVFAGVIGAVAYGFRRRRPSDV